MKIAFYNGSDGVYRLVTNAAMRAGGANKQQWLLAQTLVERGHQPVFITPSKDPSQPTCEIEGIQFIASPMKTTNWVLRRILAAERPDWLYWRTNSFHLGPCFFLASSLSISRVYACASDKDCDPRHALNPYSGQRHLWPLYHWGLDQAERILIQHIHQRELLGSRWAAKTHLVSNIAEFPQMHPPAASAAYIVWVGNMRYEKRPDILAEIARQLPQYLFVAIGPLMEYRSQAGYEQSSRAALSVLPNVEFHGALSSRQTLDLIAGAALFLSTSEQEGFPNTMLEAWSLGVPVVSLKLDPGGVIQTHNLGRVTKDVNDTLYIVEKLMISTPGRCSLGENGLRYVAKNHSPSTVYKQLIDALSPKRRKEPN